MSRKSLFQKISGFWLPASATFIIVIFLISIGAYVIAPDSTPMANEQHLETSFLKPGSAISFLEVPFPEAKSKSVLEEIYEGKEPGTQNIPIYQTRFAGDSLYVEKYTGMSPNNGAINQFHLSRFCGIPFRHSSVSESQLLFLRSFVSRHFIFNRHYYLGTDRFGRDVLSRLIVGSRVSLSVGFISVLIALFIGVLAGAWAGYFGGWVDRVLMYLISVIWAIPTILLVIAVTFALGRGFWQVFIAIGFTLWVEVARIIRGQVISLKEKEFVKAAIAAGFSHRHIIIKHILPSLYGIIFVLAASDFASAIMIESGLSFLGIGIRAPMPSWGMMIKEYYGHLVLDSAYLAIIPGTAIMLLILSFMIVGRELRDMFDVKLN